MLEKIKSWLGFLPKKDIKKSCKVLTVKDVDVLGPVWIKLSNGIYSGWIYGKEKDRILVTFCDLEKPMKDLVLLTKDKNATELHKNDITVYLNDPRR